MFRSLALFILLSVAASAQTPTHVTVYKQDGRFAGWPANHGIWSWGDEILVGFEVGIYRHSERTHAIDYSQPASHVLARSLDGGLTWKLEDPDSLQPPPNDKVAGVPTGTRGRPLTDCAGGMDFSNPNFVFTARMTSIHDGQSRYYYSTDRGKSWTGPCRLPNFGQPGIAARTDYVINGKRDMTVFLTAAKSDRREGRVIAVRTKDGGKTWNFVSYVTPEPEGNEFAIMPATVRLPSGTLLSAVRCRNFIDLYQSTDDAKTWTHVGRPAPETGGNPPTLTLLKDGRLALTYGYRLQPFGLRARISSDNGKTWSDEIVLRTDGGSRDLGYPRTIQRKDGRLVTVYYYNVEDKERFIGATIWDPGKK